MAWAFVQVQDSGGFTTATFGSALTNPSVIIAAVSVFNQASPSIVTDTAGNTYVRQTAADISVEVTPDLLYSEIFIAQNTQTTSSNVVTVTTDGSMNNLRILEYSGLATSSAVDKVNASNGNDTTPQTNSGTTTAANELIFGHIQSFGGSLTAGSGYTARGSSFASTLTEDKNGATLTNYTANATCGTGPWTAQIVTFKQVATAFIARQGLNISQAVKRSSFY